MVKKTIGILGGTFDPIHYGHLRAALEVKEALTLNEMRIIPCRHPPHRESPIADPEQRLHMCRLATKNTELCVDHQEMQRAGPSYTIDTLMALRRDYPKASLSMVVGIDAFLGLSSWYQWKKIMQLANIIVIHRSGWSIPIEGMVSDLFQTYAIRSNRKITAFQSSKIITLPITSLEISATKIRQQIAEGGTPRFLLPEIVWQYIQEQTLYGYNAENFSQTLEVNH